MVTFTCRDRCCLHVRLCSNYSDGLVLVGELSKMETFFESCGIADLVATCHGGRNRMLGEAVVKSDKVSKVKWAEIGE